MNKKVLLLITMLTMGTYYAQATPEWNVTINNHSGNSIEVGGIDLSQSHCWWTDPTSEGGNSFWQQRSLGNNESGVWKSPEMDFSQYNCNWGGDAHSLIARLDSQNLVLIAHYPNFYTSTPNNDWNWDIRINNTILNNTTKIPIEVISEAPVAIWHMISSVDLTIDYYGKSAKPIVKFTGCKFPDGSPCTIN